MTAAARGAGVASADQMQLSPCKTSPVLGASPRHIYTGRLRWRSSRARCWWCSWRAPPACRRQPPCLRRSRRSLTCPNSRGFWRRCAHFLRGAPGRTARWLRRAAGAVPPGRLSPSHPPPCSLPPAFSALHRPPVSIPLQNPGAYVGEGFSGTLLAPTNQARLRQQGASYRCAGSWEQLQTASQSRRPSRCRCHGDKRWVGMHTSGQLLQHVCVRSLPALAHAECCRLSRPCGLPPRRRE